MYNYLSVGVDAQVALNFHLARQSQFYMFSSRMINKVSGVHRSYNLHKKSDLNVK